MNTDSMPVGLAQVRAELDAWRGQRRRGDRIPEALWRRAACAARQHGLNAVSRALRLDYDHLKRRAVRVPAARPASPLFVELSAAGADAEQRTDTGLACVVELAKGNGTRMRICVREAVAVDWGKLKEAFLGA